MFGALAEHFGRNPLVLGYDAFNEPWPGPDWAPCATPPAGCPDQDRASLDPLYAKVTDAIRASDRRHLVFGEPFVLFNFGVNTAMSLPGNDARSGMSFHLYAAEPSVEPNVVKSALDWSAATGGALLNTEWGATADTAAITRQADLLDGALIPWMYWSYDEEIVPDLHRTPGGDNLTSAGDRDRPAPPDRGRGHARRDALRRDDEGVRLLVERAACGRRLLPARHRHVRQHPDADLSERLHGARAGRPRHFPPVRADADPGGSVRSSRRVGPGHAGRHLPAGPLSPQKSRAKRPFGGHFTLRSWVHRNRLRGRSHSRPGGTRMDFKLELVAVPVSDVDRAKDFYVQAGFNADHDHTVSDEIRFVQLTPPGSACSIAIGKGVATTEPGSVQGLQVVVADIDAARKELSGRGIEVSEVQDFPWGRFVFFSDPDGNGWAVQEVPGAPDASPASRSLDEREPIRVVFHPQ